jgi:hypothetical protein
LYRPVDGLSVGDNRFCGNPVWRSSCPLLYHLPRLRRFSGNLRPMPAPLTDTASWRIGQLAELTWDIARTAEALVVQPVAADDPFLSDYWAATRGLANRWLQGLTEWPQAVQMESDARQFTSLAVELLTGDMLLRVWSTVLAIQDRHAGDTQARAVLDLVVFNVQHARHRLLDIVLADAESFAELDRLRRRCERWTDLLLGPLVVKHGFAHYAHDPRRAWDYGEDGVEDSSGTAARLLQTSFRTAFLDHDAVDLPVSEEWTAIIAGMDRRGRVCLGRHCPGVSPAAACGATPLAVPAAPPVESRDASQPTPHEDDSPLVRALRRVQHWHSAR